MNMKTHTIGMVVGGIGVAVYGLSLYGASSSDSINLTQGALIFGGAALVVIALYRLKT